jgi:hypothetical protein
MNRDDFDKLINVLAATPDRVSRLVEGDDVEMVRHKPSDQFSILESVCHLRDIEVEGYTERITRILSEIEPSLPDIDGGKLALERDYNKQDLKQALKSFVEARKRNIDRIRNLGVGQLARVGKLEGVGDVTLERLLEMMVEHDEGHLEELEVLQRTLHRRLN